jgi:hypothetical protein
VNVRLIKKEIPVPEGAPPSPTPAAEEALKACPGAYQHYATRDALEALEAPPVITGAEVRAGLGLTPAEMVSAMQADEALVRGWWCEAWSQTFQKPPFWAAPVSAPDPDAHPYPEPGTEAVPLPGDAPAEDGPDGTRVIPAVSAETEIVPAVAEEDGGPQS